MGVFPDVWVGFELKKKYPPARLLACGAERYDASLQAQGCMVLRTRRIVVSGLLAQ